MTMLRHLAQLLVAPVLFVGGVTFDESAAKMFLRYARISFCSQSHVEAWDCGEDCDAAGIQPGSARFLGPTEDWAMQGYVAELPQSSSAEGDPSVRCILGMRGSVDIANWIADAEFYTAEWSFPTRCEGCRIHAGFHKAYSDLRDQIFQAIGELKCSSLVFAGHSLGAAMVTIAAFEAREGFGIFVEDVWTFGKPRVGNAAWATRFVEAARTQGQWPPLWRVVHYKDPATRVGWQTWFGYLHEHHEVWYPDRESTRFTVCANDATSEGEPIEDPSCSANYPLPYCLLYPDMDHNMYLNMSMRGSDEPTLSCKASDAAGVPVAGEPVPGEAVVV